MVDDSRASRPHTGLPMAPRLQRSMRLRRALGVKRPVIPPLPRPGRTKRFRFGSNFITFIAAQLLIAAVAFLLVRDYMADGYVKNALSGLLNQNAGGQSNLEKEIPVAVEPPVALEEIPGQEIAEVPPKPATVEQVKPPPVETQDQPTAALPQAELQVAAPVVEPEPVPQIVEPIVEPPAVAPQAEAPTATPPVVPAPESSPAEQTVAIAPVPDLAPLEEAPSASQSPELKTPQQAEGRIIRDCDNCPELALVTPGHFLMGAGIQQASVDVTQDVAIAAPFAIGRYEVTFDEWDQCVSDGDCTSQPADENWGRGRRPVINVSFNEITQQYLPWLSRKTGLTYRLPTEAEWEYAARGGASAAAGQAYSFGDDAALLCEYGNSSDLAAGNGDANWKGTNCNDGFAKSAPAGSMKANALGLFDMHGNVWEWTADCWHPQYSAKPAEPGEACNSRVMRGGSWASDAPALRSAARGWEKQDKSKNSIGFRVARQQP